MDPPKTNSKYNYVVKTILIIAAITAGVGLSLFFTNRRSAFRGISGVKIGEAFVKVEIADTVAKRAKGLMFRKSLSENEGMLFIFPLEGKHTFWMANTYIPLDIIWISSDMKVVHIEENVPPCTETGSLQALCKLYRPGEDAKYVLEVKAGWVGKKAVATGFPVEFKNAL